MCTKDYFILAALKILVKLIRTIFEVLFNPLSHSSNETLMDTESVNHKQMNFISNKMLTNLKTDHGFLCLAILYLVLENVTKIYRQNKIVSYLTVHF